MDELPELKEQLKEVRKGDDILANLVNKYNLSKDGRRWLEENQVEKHGDKTCKTAELWENQLRSKILPFLHQKYQGVDLSILIDFGEEEEHTNYNRTEPASTKKLHWFTEDDMVESVSQSFKSLPHPGPSKIQLIQAWMALCRTIAWHAKHNKGYVAMLR